MTHSTAEQAPSDATPDAVVSETDLTHGPMRSFFDPYPDYQLAHAVLVQSSKEQRQLLASSSGTSLILHLLEDIGYLPGVPSISPRSELKNAGDPREVQRKESDQQREVLIARKPILDIVSTATNEYRELFWEDFSTGQGLDTDRIDELAEITDPYASESAIHSTIVELRRQHPQNTHLADAQRIVQLILLRERQPVPVTT